MRVSDSYLDTYQNGGIYDNSTYGNPYASKGVKFARFLKPLLKKNSKVLCIGCGNGFEVMEYLQQGHDAYGTELHDVDVGVLNGRIIKAVVPDLPFKDNEFDLLHCTEVMEHIPTENTDIFLKECKRVSKSQLFSVATDMDIYKTHINIQTPSWWYETFVRNDFQIKNFQYKPITNLDLGIMQCQVYYPNGVIVYADGNN